MGKRKKNKIGIMYSTNANYDFEFEKEKETLTPENQYLEVWIDKKNESLGRQGSPQTAVRNFFHGPFNEHLLL